MQNTTESTGAEEQQYLNIIRTILEKGSPRDDRTGTGTLSVFSPLPMRFDLEQSFPLLTTKRMYLRPIFEELMWFIRGQTNANILRNKKVYIWEANGTRSFLNSRKLYHLREGDLGPIYGFQWRHFGAKYTDCDANYDGCGVDQLYNVIRDIMFNKTSRRIILTAWNPTELDNMALPPCHMTCQFYVCDNKLSCQLYQRSADIGLGVPFNIASYSMFVRLLAHVCGLEPGEFIHVMGDAHIYNNHIDALKMQIRREPRPLPKLIIKKEKLQLPAIDETLDKKTKEEQQRQIILQIIKELESFEFTDLSVVDYNPHIVIHMEMSA